MGVEVNQNGRSVPSISRIVATGAATAIVFGAALACVSASERGSTDRGVTSALAITGLSPHQAMLGDLSVVGISPEDSSAGRIALWAAIGEVSDSQEPPAESLAARSGSGDDSAMAEDRQGITLVVGGEAAEAFAECEPSVDAKVWADVAYDDLSRTEKTGVVESITSQLMDRQPQFGEPTQASDLDAIDRATSMAYTVIEPTSLTPWSFELDGTDPDQHPSPTDSDEQEGEASTTTSATGWGTYFFCDVSFESLWTTQSWGARFELPALAVAAPATDLRSHTVARIGLTRESELSRFSYTGEQGFERRELEENWAGLTSERGWDWGFSDTRPVAVMPDVALSFSSMEASSSRDVSLFVAGVALSLFATLLVALARQIRDRRSHH